MIYGKFFLALFLAVNCFLGLCAAEQPALELEDTVSWMTTDYPEVHVILKNKTDEPIEFSLVFGATQKSSSGQECSKKLQDFDVYYGRKTETTARTQTGSSKGLIQPHGWTHRIYRLGAKGLIPPCKLTYLVKYKYKGEFSVIEKTVDIPYYKFAGHVGDSDVRDIDLVSDTIVEKGPSENNVIARTLIRNQSGKKVYLFVSDRDIKCDAGSRATFKLVGGVKQGEDTGPVIVRPHQWIVFKQVISYSDDSALKSCKVWIQFSTYGYIDDSYDKSMIPMRKVEFFLKPNKGMFFDDSWHEEGDSVYEKAFEAMQSHDRAKK